MSATRGQGVHGSGGRDYSPAQYRLVVDAIKAIPDGEVVTVAELLAQKSLDE